VGSPSSADLYALLRTRPALLLDFDGLLVDSEPLHHEAFRRAFARFGHAIDLQEYWLHFTHLGEGPSGELRRHGLQHVPVEVVVRDKAAIFSALCEMHPPSPRPGAERLLRLLSQLGWPHAIASNTGRPDIERMLVHLQLGTPPPIVGGEGRLPGKPRPDIYLAAAAALGRQPAGCVAVEDTLKGVQAAVAAGMPCLAVPGPQTAGFAFPGAAAVLDSLDRISDILEQVNHEK
jgi:beta-phosphoglucomutase-like phosphatase (HAD superfamily)